jgi:alpha-beta hydrolase superfamily lysophospholipase
MQELGKRTEGYLDRGAGVRLYCCEWLSNAVTAAASAPPRAIVVLLHGYGEHCRRYDEFAEFLLTRGHGVCRLDARGHGRSLGQRGHIQGYSEYVTDLAAYVDRVSVAHPGAPIVLMGHSNGGLTAIRAVQAGLAPVQALVLTSPLLGLRQRRKPVPDGLARLLSWGAARLPLPSGIRSSDLTHDQAMLDAHAADKWRHRVATPRWYWSMTLAGRQALADAQQVALPLLVVQAELDPMVDPAAVASFYAAAASLDKRLVTRTGEFHEVLNEVNRRELFGMIADWIERVGRAVSASSLSS